MSSLRQFAEKPQSILDTAIQMWKSSFVATVVVEGRSDVRFFTNFLNPKVVRIVAANGKKGVLQTFAKATQRGTDATKFVVDIDADLCVGKEMHRHPSLLYIAEEDYSAERSYFANDLECALIRSGVLSKICAEYSSPFSPEELLDRVKIAGSVVGALRNAIYSNALPNEIAEMSITPADFIDVRTLSIRDDRITEFVRMSSFSCEGKIIADYMSGRECALETPWLYCRGHDLAEILADHFCAFSTYRIVREEVERSLRLATEWHHIAQTPIGRTLIEWKTPPLAAIPRRPFLKAEYRV